MDENNENQNQNQNENQVFSKVPAKLSPWASFKNFLFKPIVVELTPYQRKVFQEVRDFWNQEIVYEAGNVFLRKPVSADDVQPEETTEVKVEL